MRCWRRRLACGRARWRLSVAVRLLSVLIAGALESSEELQVLTQMADLDGALACQRGRFADMDFIARTITAS